MIKIKWAVVILMIGVMFVGCTSLRPDMAFSNKGFNELKKRNYPKAEEYFDKALRINPNNSYALINMGVVYHNTERLEQSREKYQKVLDLNSNDRAWRTNENWAKDRLLTKIAERNMEFLKPDIVFANEGFNELEKGNFKKAEEYLELSLSINPKNPYAILNMGVVYHNTERLEKAREMYQKVLDLTPEDRAIKTNQNWAKDSELIELAKRNLELL